MKALRWILRKLVLVVVATMIGVSNIIFEEDKMINDPGKLTEQQEEKEES